MRGVRPHSPEVRKSNNYFVGNVYIHLFVGCPPNSGIILRSIEVDSYIVIMLFEILDK